MGSRSETEKKHVNNAYICINAERVPNITDPVYNKHYLTVREPKNRSLSCSFPSETDKEKINMPNPNMKIVVL